MSYAENGLNQCGHVYRVQDGLVYHFFFSHSSLEILWYVEFVSKVDGSFDQFHGMLFVGVESVFGSFAGIIWFECSC